MQKYSSEIYYKGDGATQDIKMQSVWQGENIERRCSAEIMGEYRDEFR